MNFDNFTIGEISLMEDISGISFKQIESAETPIGKVFQALVYIMARKAGTPLTLDEVADLPMHEANRYLEPLSQPVNPT